MILEMRWAPGWAKGWGVIGLLIGFPCTDTGRGTLFFFSILATTNGNTHQVFIPSSYYHSASDQEFYARGSSITATSEAGHARRGGPTLATMCQDAPLPF